MLLFSGEPQKRNTHRAISNCEEGDDDQSRASVWRYGKCIPIITTKHWHSKMFYWHANYNAVASA